MRPVPISFAFALVMASSALGQSATGKVKPQFVNVADEAGITAMVYCGGEDKDHILESTGSGGAMIDYDGDGRLDIYVVNAWALDENPSGVRIRGKNRLYRNRGHGKFEDVTAQAGVGDDGWGCGVCAGDYDNDGLLDLYVTNFGPNRLYRNLGGGRFKEVAERAGVAEAGWGAGASFFDADGDGWLDLYVVNYIDCTMEEVLGAHRTNRWQQKAKVMSGPFGMPGGKDKFYHNNGDGTFRDATEEVGMKDIAEGYGLGIIASDLDLDGDVDVYVANDSNPNFLYRNEGDGKFTEVGAWSGAGYNAEGMAQAGMGVDAGDFDGDGLPDIFVTNFARDSCTLYKNTGELFFEDISAGQKLQQYTHSQLSWGCALFDYDLDADLDIAVVNGHIYPQVDDFAEFGESYRQLPLLFRNDGGQLANVSRQAGAGFQIPISGRGLALGDYDNDGDQDMLIIGIDAPPLLLRNDSKTGNWIKLRLLNRHGGPAINARAVLRVGDKTQMRELRSGSTYQSQNAMVLHFGLDEATSAKELKIHWPGGAITTHGSIVSGKTHTFREPAR